MSKALKKIMTNIAIASALAMGGASSEMPYGLVDRPPHVTTESERLFVKKQGYKPPSVHDREDQRKRRLKRQVKKKRGHKHGGGRK